MCAGFCSADVSSAVLESYRQKNCRRDAGATKADLHESRITNHESRRSERQAIHGFGYHVFLDLNQIGIRPRHSQQRVGVATL